MGAGRLPHPRNGRLVEFLLTHHGRRLTPYALRGTLARAARAAGIDPVTPHQLRHTYATALINAGVSLQALMAPLSHSSAEMSLRYGRLFDATVRADYERALTLAKERLGPVLPEPPAAATDSDWRELPIIKSRMAGGYCLRTAAQGVCAYTNICEHCPNYRSEPAMLAVLSAQRVDAQALAQDAQRRGWNDEATRHAALVDRLDAIITKPTTAAREPRRTPRPATPPHPRPQIGRRTTGRWRGRRWSRRGGRRPQMSQRRPAVTSSTANVIVYALTVHCSPPREAPRSAWIDGGATFTTVLSSMIMKSAKHSAPRVHQRRLASEMPGRSPSRHRRRAGFDMWGHLSGTARAADLFPGRPNSSS